MSLNFFSLISLLFLLSSTIEVPKIEHIKANSWKSDDWFIKRAQERFFFRSHVQILQRTETNQQRWGRILMIHRWHTVVQCAHTLLFTLFLNTHLMLLLLLLQWTPLRQNETHINRSGMELTNVQHTPKDVQRICALLLFMYFSRKMVFMFWYLHHRHTIWRCNNVNIASEGCLLLFSLFFYYYAVGRVCAPIYATICCLGCLSFTFAVFEISIRWEALTWHTLNTH